MLAETARLRKPQATTLALGTEPAVPGNDVGQHPLQIGESVRISQHESGRWTCPQAIQILFALLSQRAVDATRTCLQVGHDESKRKFATMWLFIVKFSCYPLSMYDLDVLLQRSRTPAYSCTQSASARRGGLSLSIKTSSRIEHR